MVARWNTEVHVVAGPGANAPPGSAKRSAADDHARVQRDARQHVVEMVPPTLSKKTLTPLGRSPSGAAQRVVW